jgi:hypothetical protein
MTMQNINQLICFIVVVVLMATSCMTSTIEVQANADDRLFQVRAATITSGCTQVTITPAACSSYGCTLTFYRAGDSTYGITLSGGEGVYGVHGFSGVPTSVRFDHTLITPNGSAFSSGFLLHLPSVTFTGITSAKVFTTSGKTNNNSIPIVITGAIIARSAINFGVANIGGIQSVTIGDIISNAGNTVTLGRPGNGAATVNLCAPK